MAASSNSALLDDLSKKPGVLQEEFGSDGEVSQVRRKGPVDSFRHRKLLDAIGSLAGKNKVTPRTEPSLTVSEYDLSKASVEKVAVHQLLMNLKKTEAHWQIIKKVRSIVRNAKVLAEPLHGPQQQRAEQLRFPLNQPSLKMESAGNFIERFKPKTDLEREINKVLKVCENVTPLGAELTPAEEKALEAMSLEEAKERLAELKKIRALLSYQEMKARRQGKIKSKKYHRVLKKERLKKEMKEFEELKEKDPELAIEKLKELEKQRTLERVSLRHRGTGKWAKQQMLRTKYNQESREALLKQLELSRQLTQKPLVESSDDEGAMDTAAAQEVAAAHTGELEARFFNSAKPDKVEVDPTKFLEVKQQILKSRTPDLGGTAEDALDDEDMEKEQAITIAEAFADDDVISAFREEKKAQVKQDAPQGVDLFLPGWGSWGGSGIKVDRKKRRRFFVKPPPAPPRKDQTLGYVIINEAKDEKLEAHQVSALPFPFNNVSQFESVISHPVGSLWNPETSFRELAAPKVVAKIGQVIDPMDREALIVKKKENVVDKLLEQKKAETKHKQQLMRWRKK